jgi:hypothetical protein
MFPYCKHTLLVPPECLGLRLRPFSLGHIDLLTALEHPVAVGSPALMSSADVAVAVWVCAHAYEEGISLYQSGQALEELQELGELWGGQPEALEEQRAILLDYLETYLMAPPRWDPEKESQPVIPWHLSVFAALQRDLNYTPDALWNLPLPRALELFAAVAANRGDDSLVTLTEQAIFEQMNEVKQ